MSDKVYTSLEWLDSETPLARALAILIERGSSSCHQLIIETHTPTETTNATSGRNTNASQMICFDCIRLRNTTLPDGRRVFTVIELGNNICCSHTHTHTHTHTYAINLRNGAIVAFLVPRIPSVIVACTIAESRNGPINDSLYVPAYYQSGSLNLTHTNERESRRCIWYKNTINQQQYSEAIFRRPFGHHCCS